jgi:V/A-type H+-transporting ATPase subunit C
MDTLLSYSGINTKIRAMHSRLITKEDYQKLANLETTADFIAFLKHHPGYSDVFKKYNEHELHRFDAERIFIYAFYNDYAKIYRFANQTGRKNLELFFLRHEVTLLKNCIHRIYNHEDTYDLSLFQEFFDRHSNINLTALVSSRSMEEFTRQLKDTQYYPLFSRLQNEAVANPFDYEMQLDIYYFKRIWKIKGKLVSGNTLKAVTRRLGAEIDMLNIMWIYRAKTMYDINPADLLTYIIPVNYKLSKEQLLKLVRSASLEEYASILKTTYYKDFYSSLEKGNLENTYQRLIDKIYKENKAKYPASMSSVNYYLHQKETEIARLTTALECIRYNLDPKDKIKYIFNEG